MRFTHFADMQDDSFNEDEVNRNSHNYDDIYKNTTIENPARRKSQ